MGQNSNEMLMVLIKKIAEKIKNSREKQEEKSKNKEEK